ncbi:MAG TPA: ComEC/Rec2 family competence protein [Candidatus Dormibacteraeota bacterium]|nr:ComEC/Rec2 family competence protein [Candidatus Dormibacteraeota bacterium]
MQLKRSTQITLLAIFTLAGIIIGRNSFSIDVILIFTAAAIAVVLMILKSRLALLWLLAACLLLGMWRGDATRLENTALGQNIGQKVTLTGTISDDPVRTDKGFVSFTLKSLEYDGQPIAGAVRMQTNYKKLQRGYRVKARGKLGTSLGAVQTRIGFAQTEVISTETSWLEQLRQRFFASLRSYLPEDLASFSLGLLVGARGLIPRELQDQLTVVGLTHLIAVSGYNLTIIIQAVYRLLGRASNYIATAGSLWLIAGFLIVAGFSASIVRAAFVAVLGLAAAYYGRRVKPMTLIALPAAVTALIKPDYLIYDLGWQLSFLAFFGILVLAPLAESRLFKRPNAVTMLAAQSIAAHIMTFPLILLIFGNLSVVSPLANLLILPLIPLAMLLSFSLGIVGMTFPIVAAWLGLPTAGLLAMIVGVVQWMNGWEGASAKYSADLWQVAALYIAIAVLTFVLTKKVRGIRQVDTLKDKVLA